MGRFRRHFAPRLALGGYGGLDFLSLFGRKCRSKGQFLRTPCIQNGSKIALSSIDRRLDPPKMNSGRGFKISEKVNVDLLNNPDWSKIFPKSIQFDPWVVLGRFRRHFAPTSALGAVPDESVKIYERPFRRKCRSKGPFVSLLEFAFLKK